LSDHKRSGQLTGCADLSNGRTHAYLYESGAMIDLGTLGGKESYAEAINDAGMVAGHSLTAKGYRHGFVYDGTQLRDIDSLGGDFSQAVAINAAGMAVGSATSRHYGPRAVAWSAADGLVDLNKRISDAPSYLMLEEGLAINDKGQIVVRSNRGLALLNPRP
jgi:probable HAF family extracellular repeat protein